MCSSSEPESEPRPSGPRLKVTIPMTDRIVPPSISAVSFNCPHCGALADQVWYDLYAVRISNHGVPQRADEKLIELLQSDTSLPTDVRQRWVNDARRGMRGEVFFSPSEDSHYKEPDVVNISLSNCYSCKQLSVWIHDRVLYPPLRTGVTPNADLPPDITHDYDEARLILDLSPRGAAALLRREGKESRRRYPKSR
jgi:hypothetical protein